MNKCWLTWVGLLLFALLFTACGQGSSQSELGDQPKSPGAALVGATPGRPALVEFWASW
jgi:hypothetical protein